MNSELPKVQPLPKTLSAAVNPVNTLAADHGDAWRASTVAALQSTGYRGACVLLVDDSDIVREVSRAVLEDAGVVVDEAHDGAMAVRLLRQHPARYALVLMDVEMPVLDGLAATQMIQADLGARTPPVVALTAHVSESEKRRCLAAGMCDHVPKPVDPVQLVAVINRWLAPQSTRVASAVAAGTRAASEVPLPEVPGFDLQAGLQCVGGNVQRLRGMLARFAARYTAVVAELRQLMAPDNCQKFDAARRLAHTLKGAAATLGGTQIANAAQRVEAIMQQRCEAAGGAGPMTALVEHSAQAAPAALDGAPRDALEDALSDALSELDAALQRALPVLRGLEATHDGLPERAAAAIPRSEVAAFDSLRQLLAGNCYAARQAFAALRARLGANDAAWQAAAAAVDALDFQQALAQLDACYPARQDDTQ